MRITNERAVRRSIRRTADSLEELDGRGIAPAAVEIVRQARARGGGSGARSALGTSLGRMTGRAMSSLTSRDGEISAGVPFAVGAELGGQGKPTTRQFGRYRPAGYVIGPIVADPDRRLEAALLADIDEGLDEWGRGTRGAF